MNLRFKRMTGETIFEIANFVERDMAPPNTLVVIDGVKYFTRRHERVYQTLVLGTVSFFDIYVQNEEEYVKEKNTEMNNGLPQSL